MKLLTVYKQQLMDCYFASINKSRILARCSVVLTFFDWLSFNKLFLSNLCFKKLLCKKVQRLFLYWNESIGDSRLFFVL